MTDETPTTLREVLPALRGAPLAVLTALASSCLIGYARPVCVSDLARETGYTRRMVHLALLVLARLRMIDLEQDHRRKSPSVRLFPTLRPADPVPFGANLDAAFAWTPAPSPALVAPASSPVPVSPGPGPVLEEAAP